MIDPIAWLLIGLIGYLNGTYGWLAIILWSVIRIAGVS